MAGTRGEDEWGKGGKEVISEHCRRKWECRETKVKVDGRREGGPEEDGCYRLEDTCTQKDGCHKLEDTCTQKDGCHKLEDTCKTR